MLTAFGRSASLLCACLFLAACAPVATTLGFSPPIIRAAVQLDEIKMVADGISYADTGKTVSDHMISAVTGDDCKLFNALGAAPVCVHETQ
jgi:uncharacterized lipoprotein YajG